MKKETLLVRAGRPKQHGPVNVPVQRASTITFETVAQFEAARRGVYDSTELYYGLFGTQTAFAFEEAIAQLEGGYRALAFPSGLAAITASFFAFAGNGDHVLVPDSAYGPVREFCDTTLRASGVETTYYDPHAGAGILEWVRSNTKLIYLESPGSLTFEVQDVPAIANVARERGITTALDNTWATPLFFSAFDHGVDISLHAATKYIGGHSDVMSGVAVTNERVHRALRQAAGRLGFSASPDDCYLALRGLRTLGVRLRRHEASALRVATWLRQARNVREVLHPGLDGARGNAIWKRDFSGASGLFAFILTARPEDAARFVEALQLFAIGASWGGYESLVMLCRPPRSATALPYDRDNEALIRLNIGLEDPDDLIEDLARAFPILVT